MKPWLLVGFLAFAAPLAFSQSTALPGTQPLTMSGNLSDQMHQAALRDMDAVIAGSAANRAQYWRRDVSSPEAYAKSIEPNREHFRKIIGLVDMRLPVVMERFGDDANPALVAETPELRIFQVRWTVLPGIHGEGLLLEPKGKIQGWVVAVPDADQTPEQIAGLVPGVPLQTQFARRFAENGFEVIVPTLLDRSDTASGRADIAMTNEPHREWIHRQAYMMGRHVIGYEVQKVLAAVDWFVQRRGTDPVLAKTKIGVAGYGEGGLLAFYAAAVEARIDAALVSGYFKPREQTWSEPLYRNVWGLLREFGDAEIASLIAPRGLIIEHSSEPKVDGPPAVTPGVKNCAAPGKLTTPTAAEVQAEYDRINGFVPARLQSRLLHLDMSGAPMTPIGQATVESFTKLLGVESPMPVAQNAPKDVRRAFDPIARQVRQVRELDDAVQWLLRDSDQVRNQFFLYQVMPEFAKIPWNYNLRFPTNAPEKFTAAAADFRRMFWDDVIGRLDAPLPPLNPRSRKIYDQPKWTGYEVVVDTGAEGFAWGVLLLPKDLKPGEKRPVVVCQHGRHGIPSDVIEGDKPAYRNFAVQLVERGFITFAPHNLYQKEEYYRILSRKGNTVKASMFSVILRHHEQWLTWLATLPNVDAQRIGFYGLSYGGESAVRLPTLLEGYALSICSGDFNDWTRKVASTHDARSFMFTDEWEMPYFNMGSTFSYAELSYLMFPRPFMVERGHHDGVSVDSWVASEYAKTSWFYAQFGLQDRTAIEFFNGGHAINGEGTFDFLHQHLRWPKPAGKP